MNCPHCNKVIIVKVFKDSNVGQAAPSNGEGTGDLGELIEAARHNPSLDGKSSEFVEQTFERWKKWGSNIRMTEKQMKWLRGLANPETEEEWS